jgi:hypothetical protein
MNYVRLLKRSLLFFWAIWLTVVFLSNLADAGKEAGLIGESWTFASGNWKSIQETTARYGTPDFLNAFLFAGVILWEGLATVLFWWAFWTFRSKSGRTILYYAFMVSLLLWASFMVSDEVFIAYAVEATHQRLFIAFLVTLLAIELLPEDEGDRHLRSLP